MKKIGFKLLSILMMAAVCVGFAACGDDDDDENGGGGDAAGYISIDGKTYNVSHGYYYLESNMIYVNFYNYDHASAVKNNDLSALPETINMFSIVYPSAGSPTPPTGDYNEFEIDFMTINKSDMLAGDDMGTQYIGYPSEGTESQVLKVQKNGNKYTFQCPEMVYHNYPNDKKTVRGAAFSISCTLAPEPEGGFSIE